MRFGKYQPGPDPCEICHCSGGRKDMCMNVGCIPPPCPNPEPVPGVCCKFICREPTKIPLMQTPEGNEVGYLVKICIYYSDILLKNT